MLLNEDQETVKCMINDGKRKIRIEYAVIDKENSDKYLGYRIDMQMI